MTSIFTLISRTSRDLTLWKCNFRCKLYKILYIHWLVSIGQIIYCICAEKTYIGCALRALKVWIFEDKTAISTGNLDYATAKLYIDKSKCGPCIRSLPCCPHFICSDKSIWLKLISSDIATKSSIDTSISMVLILFSFLSLFFIFEVKHAFQVHPGLFFGEMYHLTVNLMISCLHCNGTLYWLMKKNCSSTSGLNGSLPSFNRHCWQVLCCIQYFLCDLCMRLLVYWLIDWTTSCLQFL